jgi:NitT/TauT family transport system substrate-binding protein
LNRLLARWLPGSPWRAASGLLVVGVLLAACATPAAAPSPSAAPAKPVAPAGAAAPPPAPDGTAATAPTAQAAPREPVRVVQALPTRDFGFLPGIVAISKGFAGAEGIQLELPVMPANAAIPAITNKEVQLASAGSGTRAAYQGAPLRGIFYYYSENTLIPVGSSEVRSYKDLAGKVLAIASPGSSEDWVIKLLLNREGIPLSDVQIVALGQGPQRVQAMLAGQVQFSVLNADLAVDLERKGFNILGDVRSLMPIPWSGFVVHQDTLREQPDLIKAWIRAHVHALQFMKQNPAETAAIATRELGLDPDLARRAVELVLPAISDDDPGGFTEAGLILNAQLDMEAVGIAGDPAELAPKVQDLTLLRQVQRELGIHCTTGYQCR